MSNRISSITLIAANLGPLVGVLFFDWQVLEILLLYWVESLVVGIVNVLRMYVCRADNPLAGLHLPKALPAGKAKALENLPALMSGKHRLALRLFLIPFFALHYGAFCYAHAAVVLGFFSEPGTGAAISTQLSRPSFLVAAACIAVSHLYSFAANFIGRGEYRRIGIVALMQRPYGRIVAMHIAIVFGAFLVSLLGTAVPMLAILVGAKIVVDLRFHNAERNRLAAVPAPAAQESGSGGGAFSSGSSRGG